MAHMSAQDSAGAPLLRFAGCELDAARMQLRRDGALVEVQPLVLELILCLASHRQRVVTRDELVAEVWKQRAVSDAAIARALRKAREALGDSGDAQSCIKTVHGRGYRFVATLTEGTSPVAPAALEPAPEPAPDTGLSEPWVGRETQTARFCEVLERARKGRGATWLVSGEAGIGKTRLLERCLELARQRDCHVYAGRGQDLPGAPACFAWLPILQAALGDLPAAQAEPLRAGLAPLLSDGLLSPDLEEPTTRFRVFESVLSLLRALAARRPVLVAIDDVQHVDASSFALAEWVARQARQLPLVLLCTRRQTGEATAGGPSFAALVRGGSELVEMSGLSRAELVELVQQQTGAPPSALLASELHERTGGNPLYVQHLWGLLQARKTRSRRGLPETLREAILSQVRELTGGDHEVLGAASAVGERFTIAEVASGAALPIDRVASQLEAASEHGLLRPLAQAASSLGFSHGLVREALYEALAPERRAEIHGRLVQRLQDEKHNVASGWTGLVAYHALRGPLALRTSDGIRYGLLAIEESFRRGAFDRSATLCEATLSAMALTPTPHPERESVALRLASALGRCGRLDEAAEAFRAASQTRWNQQSQALLRGLDAATLHDLVVRIGQRLPQVVHLMYGRLFAAHPATRAMFRSNASEVQERMLADTLTSILEHVQDAPWLAERLFVLGARHAEYGVTAEMYEWVGSSLRGALQEVCQDGWTAELARAWDGAYRAISAVMGQGARLTLPQAPVRAPHPPA
jgi:DNA-binding winged helix-turn-helix (wHTH) protein/hemoglobin-like flavoprotein